MFVLINFLDHFYYFHDLFISISKLKILNFACLSKKRQALGDETKRNEMKKTRMAQKYDRSHTSEPFLLPVEPPHLGTKPQRRSYGLDFAIAP
jgi:hypothetical protein